MPLSRAFRQLAWLAVTLLVHAPAPTATPEPEADPAICVGFEKTPVNTTSFARRAVALLRWVGYDPADYRLEIRREDPLSPNFPDPAAERLTSAVFLPRERSTAHAVRVNAAHPCVLSWLWEPSLFTPWQREAVRRALDAAGRSGLTWDAPGQLDVSVLESRDEIGVHLFSPQEAREPSLHLRLNKKDLKAIVAEETE